MYLCIVLLEMLKMKIHIFLTRVALLIFFVIAVSLNLAAQKQIYIDYIKKYSPLAIYQMERYAIPASVTLAQGLLETNGGTSTLATQAHNHFGIKCGSDWTGKYVLRDDNAPDEKFRCYDSDEDSYEDHSQFLRFRERYSGLFKLDIYDYNSWCYGLKAAGYATDKQYPVKLIQLIEDYKLYQYDKSKKSKGTDMADVPNRKVYYFNSNFYVIAQQGDSYESIAKEMKMKERKLRKYNEVDETAVLAVGDIVYFKPKQYESHKMYRGYLHIVKPGQSMHTLSQLYGVRMSTLYRINALDNNHAVHVGEAIRIRW